MSANRGIELYLNDHLAGAMLGSDLAAQIRDRTSGTPLGDSLDAIASEIEEDRQTLIALIQAMGTRPNPVKKATGWMAEKASRLKLAATAAGEPDHGLFMAAETLRLGVAGKRCLWIALQEVQDADDALLALNLDELIERASRQAAKLESVRLKLARGALAS